MSLVWYEEKTLITLRSSVDQLNTIRYLSSSVLTLKGVGTEVAKKLQNLDISSIRDLIFHKPLGVVKRQYIQSLALASPGAIVTVVLKIDKHYPPRHKKLPYRIMCSDAWGELELTFFHANTAYLKSLLPEGSSRVVSGKISAFNKGLQISHPDHIGPINTLDQWVGSEPTYPLTHGVSQKQIRKIILTALSNMGDLSEWHDANLLKSKNWPSFKDALYKLHHPLNDDDFNLNTPWRERLAFDELYAQQIALYTLRNQEDLSRNHHYKVSGHLKDKALRLLPFQLTSDQKTVLAELEHDMNAPHRMVRLLQGDVGCGKTIVAFMALLNRVESGHQGALLAPTEILIRQHYKTLSPLAEQLGIKTAILTGSDKKSDRKKILADLESGEIHIIFGTHAIIQEDVHFKNLGLAIIDEQHRFGVNERLRLAEKGTDVDTLVMTATPIPRTLLLASYGDLACSYVKTKPSGRKDIDTRTIPRLKINSVVEALKREIHKGGKIYWVCPLVENSDLINLTAAEERYENLKTVFKDQIGLIHGRMKSSDKEEVMSKFVDGTYKILIATTVIEVGVDVRDATVMIIEHADRFGLSQLHQLRGRIGRGSSHAVCILLYDSPLNPIAEARLRIMRETNDGFKIAEEDLRLRGGGEILGLRQSGIEDFIFASLDVHHHLLEYAHQIIQKRFQISRTNSNASILSYEQLLDVFDKNVVAKYLNAG